MPGNNFLAGYGYYRVAWGDQLGGWGQIQQPPIQQVQIRAKVALEPPPVPDEEGDMINTFKVGCDPEFMLLNGVGGTVPASNYFPIQGEIGYDHGGRVAEFRPAPARGVMPIIKKIQALIVNDPVKSLNTRLRAGAICNLDCLGGHVHFGFNCFAQKPPHGCGIHQGGAFNEKGAQVTKALDALTKTLEHLDILPKNESARRRASAQGQGNNYGAYGDVRDCNGHMEYRTMASWLYDPKIAFLCLTAAKLAAADPVGTLEKLNGCHSFAEFEEWIHGYKDEDVNAARVVESLLEKGHKSLVIDPEVDFRGRWERLGL